jgi:hypothetical protein
MLPNPDARPRYSGQPLWDYFIIAHPDDEALEQIRKEGVCLLGAQPAKPHLALAYFQAKEAMEEILIRWIQNICRLHPIFMVTLLPFNGSIPHTLALRVEDPKPFMQLANSLRIIDGFIQSNDCPPLCIETHPHLALAGNLPEMEYERLLIEYADRNFRTSFPLERLLLIRRDGPTGNSRLLNSFSLSGPHPN